MRVDIWSDVICPWCYLGKRRFERALANLGWTDEVEIRWRAFQLDPKARNEPGDLHQAIDAKYGPGAFDAMTTRFTTLGAAEGIDYRFDIAKRVGTVAAHRLLAWAWDTGGAPAQGALQERLFRAYFEDGADVADHAELTALAAETGLAADRAADVLGSGGYADEVIEDLRTAAARGLTGVPAFVVDDRLHIPGAQEVETFEQVLRRARERLDR